jgi:hypothetical protein
MAVSRDPRQFSPSLVKRLTETEEVEMLVPDEGGSMTSRPIWIVVVDGIPYVRSHLGRRGKWWRRLRRDPQGVLRVGRTRVPFAAKPLTARELERELNSRVSQAYKEKYDREWPQDVRTMVSKEVAGTTLMLEPLPHVSAVRGVAQAS